MKDALVPPFTDAKVRIAIGVNKDERAALSHPVGDGPVYVLRQWLHPFIGHQDHFGLVQIVRQVHVFKLNRLDGYAALDERECQPKQMPHLVVARFWASSFEHQRIAQNKSYTLGSTVPLNGPLLHVFKRVEHHLKFGAICIRNRHSVLGVVLLGVVAVENSLRPRHHLVLAHLRLQKGSYQR